jgi:hypothetical protein
MNGRRQTYRRVVAPAQRGAVLFAVSLTFLAWSLTTSLMMMVGAW